MILNLDVPNALAEAEEGLLGAAVPETTVLDGLRRAAAALRSAGVAVPEPAGKLLRPLVAWALVPRALRAGLDERFWFGALAVQMVHEASLLHDDILDGADVRRGKDTLVARAGVGPALVLGDHYLTGAYRAAARVGVPDYLERFVEAVERTVAGEILQGRRVGTRLDEEGYLEVVRGKSGELFGAAALLGGALLGLGALDERAEFGRALGALYQRVDDLLDFCPAAATGKPPLQDYRQGKWTWMLDLAGVEDFSAPQEEVLDRIFLGRDGGPAPAQVALDLLREERDGLVARLGTLAPGDEVIAGVLDGWLRAAARGVRAQREAAQASSRDGGRIQASVEARVVEQARALGGAEAWGALFARNARTFRFAARLFPAEAAAPVQALYAYCRFTDDLVDEADGAVPGPGGSWADAPLEPGDRTARLAAWRSLSQAAFEGTRVDVPLVDEVMGAARRAGVSWRYPDALLAGVGMDLEPRPFADWTHLEEYTFGVAGAVGGWMSQLLGVTDPWMLECAHALGHGMQLTNILRDVGEDLEMGRVYLPESLLRAHGLEVEALCEARESGAAPSQAYRDALDELMARADGWYARAWPGIRRLPSWFGRPVAVAAEAYRGIHREVRRNGYDNLRRRAHTSLPAKVARGAVALLRVRG